MQRRACLEGNHAYGAPLEIGAGLTKTNCKYCNAVALDLGDAVHSVDEATSRFFGPGRRLSIFEIEQAVTAELHDVSEGDQVREAPRAR